MSVVIGYNAKDLMVEFVEKLMLKKEAKCPFCHKNKFICTNANATKMGIPLVFGDCSCVYTFETVGNRSVPSELKIYSDSTNIVVSFS